VDSKNKPGPKGGSPQRARRDARGNESPGLAGDQAAGQPRVEDTRIAQGASAEAAAARLLIAGGYRIVERNFRCKAGELDIIAARGDTLVFVEVRSRSNDEHGSAAEMIGPTKQRRVARVAAYYLEAARPAFEHCRFDIIAITAGDSVWLEDAFRL
jgi:putative endonuclease